MNEVIAGGLVGGGFALVGLLIGKLWDARAEATRWTRERQAEHERWLREARVNSYARFLASVYEVYLSRRVRDASTPSLDELRELEESRIEVLAAMVQIEIHGTREASSLANRLLVMATNKPELSPGVKDWTEVWQPLIEVCRRDLGLPGEGPT